MTRAMAAICAGAGSIDSAIRFLGRERRLWLLCAAPSITTLLVFIAATFAYFEWALDPLTALLSGALSVEAPAAWYGWLWVGPLRALSWALQILLAIVFFALLYFVFVAVGSILASPFLDALSRRIERIERNSVQEIDGGWRALLWSMGQELRRASFLVGGGLAIALLGLIPGGQLPALIGAGAFAAFFLPLEYTGFVLDRRGIRFRERRAWLWKHRWYMLGFGSAALITLAVPILNFLCLPILVTAGTRSVLDLGAPSGLEPTGIRVSTESR